MATLSRTLTIAALACFGFPGCGKLVGLETPVTPLAQIQVQVTGDIASVQRADTVGQTPQLRVALVWGAQWLPEPFCLFPPPDVLPPPQSPGVQAVVAAGCPDNFRFVPDRAGADIPVQPGVPGTIDLINLPGADVMVGDLTARVAYASLIVYDDRNGNGALDFRHPPQRHHHDEGYDPGTPATRDIPYGASFISMTLSDQRVAYREGADSISAIAFYPRKNCAEPPSGFSILSAGGFSQAEALVAALQQQLPGEDPTTCGEAKLDEAVVTIPLQVPAGLTELSCTANDTGGTTTYAAPPDMPFNPGITPWACVGFPKLPGDDAGVPLGSQLVVASGLTDACQSVTHITLRGCDNDPTCSAPSWDVTATPPVWWPCPTTP